MFPRAARKVVAESVMNRLALDGAAWPPTADRLLEKIYSDCLTQVIQRQTHNPAE